MLDENKRLGGVECILEALNTHQTDPSVFEWGCRALHSMFHKVDDPSDFRESVIHSFERDMMTVKDQNGIHIISNAMKHHISECLAQVWALKLLFHLQDRQSPAATERVAKTMKEEEVASTCIKIIKARSTSADLFQQAAETLSLMLSCSNKQSANHGVMECIPSVTRFMGEHKHNVSLQVSITGLLATIA